MLSSKRRVKWLDAESRVYESEAFRRHERNGPEAPNVSIVKRTTVVQLECNGRVATLALGQRSAIDQQGAGEPRLNEHMIARGHIYHDEFRSTPAPFDCRTREPARKLRGSHVAQHIGTSHTHADDSHSRQLAIEVASDRLSLR